MRIAVISDIHSNLAALQAVLADAAGCDTIWCLGDLVGYGPDPNECVEMVRARKPLCVAGNHDWAALGKLDTAEFNSDAERAALWTRDQLTPANRAYLEALPSTLVDGDFTLVHGSPREPIWEYLLSLSVARANFPLFGTAYCFVGHSHVPFIIGEAADGGMPESQQIPLSSPYLLHSQRLFINPGSVGQPRDGNPAASYAIVDTVGRTVEHRRVSYPVAKTQERMRAAGLPERLIMRLAHGW